MRRIVKRFMGEQSSDRQILARLTSTVITVLLCLAAMSFTAYAYYSYNIISDFGMIKASVFETRITVQRLEDGVVTETITPITSNYKTFKLSGLEVGQWYTITITPTEKSTAKTGFLSMTASGCKETYYTRQIGIDENASNGETPSITFRLLVTDETEIALRTYWGTSSYYSIYGNQVDMQDLYIGSDEDVKMIINDKEEPAVIVEVPDAPTDQTEPDSAEESAEEVKE